MSSWYGFLCSWANIDFDTRQKTFSDRRRPRLEKVNLFQYLFKTLKKRQQRTITYPVVTTFGLSQIGTFVYPARSVISVT